MRVTKNSTAMTSTTTTSSTRPMILASFFMITPVNLFDRETLKLVQQCCHLFPQGEAGGKTRRLDAEQADEACHAMLHRPLQLEIRRGRAGPAELGAHPGVAGHQALGLATGPVALDRPGKLFGQVLIDAVVQRLGVMHIRAEAQ